jgi:hypothetical protein
MHAWNIAKPKGLVSLLTLPLNSYALESTETEQGCKVVDYEYLRSKRVPDQNIRIEPRGFGADSAEGCLLADINEPMIQQRYPD